MLTRTQMSLDERRELCQGRVTLDGQPAVVGGVRNDYATVASLDGKLAGEWSWQAVRRVRTERGGRFTL